MRRWFFGVSAVLGASACHLQLDQNLTGTEGTYPLVAVDAAALPFAHGAASTIRGTLQMDGNGRYSIVQTDSLPGSAAFSSFASQGAWVLTNTTLQFTGDDGSFRLGSVFRDTVRITIASHANTYVRQ
jgi:hypothetical protein